MRVRTLWISDVHLGFPGCSAAMLLDFLHRTECETLYLVGDIVDVQHMKRGLYWPQAHNDIIRTILGKAKQGTRVVFIPGNHDEVFRSHTGNQFGNIEIVDQAIHETRDGRRLLVIHGDEFDAVVSCHPWLVRLGSHVYDCLLTCDRFLNWGLRRLGMGYWSLTGLLKNKVKNAVNYIGDFEDAAAGAAKRQGVEGVVCGHIHHAKIREIHGIEYHNCGDWVESNTALVEHFDGRVELVSWHEIAAATALADEPIHQVG